MDIVTTVKDKLGGTAKEFVKKNEQRYYINIAPADLYKASAILYREMGMRFATATGIDTPAGIEILYHYSHDGSGKMFTLKVLLADKAKPEIESLTGLTKGAEWMERELWELLGVNFKGHPGLKHLLLAEDWPKGDFPLRQKSK